MPIITRALPALSLLLLAGCGTYREMTSFAGPQAAAPADSLTAQRVLGQDPAFEPLKPETGNVWPAAEEAPRATLGSADAMRNIPAYTPQVAPAR